MPKEIKGQYLYVNNTDGREGMKRILIKPKEIKLKEKIIGIKDKL